MDILDIAEICHEANRVYCRSIGDNSQPRWENAPEWQKESAINGVQSVIGSKIKFSHRKNHDNWMTHKLKTGWKYGEDKDDDKKTHPCLLPYDELPQEQQEKDELFGSLITVLRGFLD